MTKLLCVFSVIVGALVYLVVVFEAVSQAFRMESSLDAAGRLAYLSFCLICALVLAMLWMRRIPLAVLLLIVLGGFFLGAAGRSAAPSAGIHAAVGLTLFLMGYLILRIEARKLSIEAKDATQELRGRMIERLREAPRGGLAVRQILLKRGSYQ